MSIFGVSGLWDWMLDESCTVTVPGTTPAVNRGAYGVGVKAGEKWKITFSGEYGAKMKEGEPFDIGKLKFKK